MVQYQSKEGKQVNPLKHKTFPNYLMTKPDNEKEIVKEHSSPNASFIAEGLVNATPSVPFLRNGKDVFIDHHRETNQEEQPQKDYFATEKKRFNEEKRIQKKAQSLSLYKSRRPFKPTEVPSLWNSLSYKSKNERSLDYPKIKAELVIPQENLILIDLNPSEEAETKTIIASKEKTSSKPKKALHRSLQGIMDQERIQKDRPLSEPTRPEKPNLTGFNSFFE